MDAGQRRALRSFRRVHEFLAAHPVADAPISYGKQSQELTDVLAKLAQETQEQDSGVRTTQGDTKRQAALRGALWTQHMKPVSRIAREAFGLPGMDRDLKLPPKSSVSETLIAAARAMADAASDQEAVFVEHGLPQTFVQQLSAAATELDDALVARDLSERRRKTATAATRELVKRGRRAVRLLDAIMSPRLAMDQRLLSVWVSVRRPHEQGGNPGVVSEESPVAQVA